MIGYFSKKVLDNNQYLTTSDEETMLNFNDTNSHYYSRNQHVIEVEIPIGQLDNIEVNTDGGDVQIDKNSVRNFDSQFYTNGGENRYSQISKNNKLVLTINSNDGNIS